ncbi:MAG: nucleotidyl transferase AbiEii/AbiGii toxin family protein [Bacilli bacterium]|nr:nucleotidyl transferase AbiEii/AbiGii toxin family protein [Bacilli bacterium]
MSSNSAQAVKDKLRNISNEKNINFNAVLKFYMYDRFIERLSKSKYRDNIVLKGGFYLSSLFGIENRSTIDIDAAIRKAEFTEDNLLKMITEIINVDVDDNVVFKINETSSIRDEDEYGGLRVTIDFQLENVKDKFHIDMATGDPIYPRPDSYNYKSLIEKKTYQVWTYTTETVLAEKLETILNKLDTSSRMKDYYDIYLIYKFKFAELNKENFMMAVKKTFEKRKFQGNLIGSLNVIKQSSILKEKWSNYARKNNYAREIEFEEILAFLEEFINILV